MKHEMTRDRDAERREYEQSMGMVRRRNTERWRAEQSAQVTKAARDIARLREKAGKR